MEPSNQSDDEGAATGPSHETAEDDFEAAIARLEHIVTAMEEGSLPLEESLKLYEQGVALARQCQQRLDKAEAHIQILQDNLLRPADEATGDDVS